MLHNTTSLIELCFTGASILTLSSIDEGLDHSRSSIIRDLEHLFNVLGVANNNVGNEAVERKLLGSRSVHVQSEAERRILNLQLHHI